MDFSEVIAQRYSVRAFRPDPLPRALIERILGDALKSASWCNTQPWQLIITEGAATDRFREALSAHVNSGKSANPDIPFPVKYHGAHYDRRKSCAMQLYASLGIADGDRQASFAQTLKNFRLFEAPHVMIVTSHESLGSYGALDCGLFVQSFLLSATNQGVGTIAQAAIAAYSDFIREHFAIAPEQRILCGVSFGYADPSHPANQFRTERATLEELVRWEG